MMKKLILALTLIACATPVFASVTSEMPIQDRTGAFVHLDIAQVIKSTDNNRECGIQPEELKYLDHQGRVHSLDYEASGTDCASDN